MASKEDQDILSEYDFSKGIRGKYAQLYQEGTNIIKLDDDVSEAPGKRVCETPNEQL